MTVYQKVTQGWCMLPTITNVLHVYIALGDVIHYELIYTGSMQDIQNSRDCNHTVVWKLNVQTHFYQVATQGWCMLPTFTNVLHVDIALGYIIHSDLTFTGGMQDLKNSRDCNHTKVWKLSLQTHFKK